MTRVWAAVASGVTALLIAVPAFAERTETQEPPDLARCGLLAPTPEPSRECLVCHGHVAHDGHPYDVAYPRLGSAGASLRPLAEVQRRGVVLPEGRVTCLTCHAPNSPWKHKLRLPPGATPKHAVDFTRRVTYENARSLPSPRPGDAVGTKPLCLGCHALD